MTKKVKLTQKQFDWLERYKSEEEIDYAIDIQLHRKRPDSPVADWKPSEVARAFYNGYEVGPEYKVGDWVARLDGDPFNTKHLAAKVAVVHSTRLELEGQLGSFSYDFIDHATPEEIKVEQERRVWAGIGREVGEFKKDDVVRCLKNLTWDSHYDLGEMYKKGKLKGFYPAESLISFEDGESNA